jgi:hypothetical protein
LFGHFGATITVRQLPVELHAGFFGEETGDSDGTGDLDEFLDYRNLSSNAVEIFREVLGVKHDRIIRLGVRSVDKGTILLELDAGVVFVLLLGIKSFVETVRTESSRPRVCPPRKLSPNYPPPQ